MSINRRTWQEIGYLEGLRVHRNELRRNAKSAGIYLEEARKDYKDFGVFGDCGETYERLLNEKKAIFDFAVKMKIKAERFYKAEFERLCEKNPELKKFMNKKQENNKNQIFDGNTCYI